MSLLQTRGGCGLCSNKLCIQVRAHSQGVWGGCFLQWPGHPASISSGLLHAPAWALCSGSEHQLMFQRASVSTQSQTRLTPQRHVIMGPLCGLRLPGSRVCSSHQVFTGFGVALLKALTGSFSLLALVPVANSVRPPRRSSAVTQARPDLRAPSTVLPQRSVGHSSHIRVTPCSLGFRPWLDSLSVPCTSLAAWSAAGTTAGVVCARTEPQAEPSLLGHPLVTPWSPLLWMHNLPCCTRGSVCFSEAVARYPPRASSDSGSTNFIMQSVSLLSKQ